MTCAFEDCGETNTNGLWYQGRWLASICEAHATELRCHISQTQDGATRADGTPLSAAAGYGNPMADPDRAWRTLYVLKPERMTRRAVLTLRLDEPDPTIRWSD